ncbi:2'-5' RNA ligase family protein [Flavitalea sp.]|nr:2'-5' RNA ligase family protein [Flavitalea sp.]
MKLKGTALPGYDVYEYFLILSLPHLLQKEVIEIREDYHKTFETHHKIKGRPSLALALFLQYETMEEKVVNMFQYVASFFAPLEIKLQNFGSFPTHSIYIAVDENSPINSLAKNIRSNAKGLLQVNKETKPMIMLQPHIGIVRKLRPDVFEKSWLKYKDATFNSSFIASEMILLRRLTHYQKWQLVHRFSFENRTLPSIQGKLF